MKSTTDIWNEFFNHDGGGENTLRQRVNKWPFEYLVKYINLNSINQLSNRRSLDVGFGDGANMLMSEKEGFESYGVEVSQNALNNFCRNNINTTCKASLFDSEKVILPFDSSTFDLVFSLQALYYNTDFKKIVKEIYRVMKSEGYFFATFFSPNHWYFQYSKDIGNGLREWDTNFPTKYLRGAKLKYFDEKDELKAYFADFDSVRIDDFSTNFLGIEFSLWILTARKAAQSKLLGTDFYKF